MSVHTSTTALESVEDKILSHRQSQPPVNEEPRVQCLPRGTGKGGKRTRGADDKHGDAPPLPKLKE